MREKDKEKLARKLSETKDWKSASIEQRKRKPRKRKKPEGEKAGIKYYFYMLGDVIGSLRRVDMEATPIILDRWDDGKWVLSPETIAMTGLGSDADNYQEITKKEAEQYMKKKGRPT